MIALLCGIFIRLNVGAWGIIIISVGYLMVACIHSQSQQEKNHSLDT